MKIGGGGEEEVGFEPSLLPWQHLAVRRVQSSKEFVQTTLERVACRCRQRRCTKTESPGDKGLQQRK